MFTTSMLGSALHRRMAGAKIQPVNCIFSDDHEDDIGHHKDERGLQKKRVILLELCSVN